MEDENLEIKPISQIMMTPIIDVIMIMLLFFMIAYARSSPQFYAQKVDVPSSKTSKNLNKGKKTVEISINKKGVLTIKDQRVDLKKLANYLQESKKKGIKKVIIRGDKKAPYEKVIAVIDEVKTAQIPQVLLLTQKVQVQEDK